MNACLSVRHNCGVSERDKLSAISGITTLLFQQTLKNHQSFQHWCQWLLHKKRCIGYSHGLINKVNNLFVVKMQLANFVGHLDKPFSISPLSIFFSLLCNNEAILPILDNLSAYFFFIIFLFFFISLYNMSHRNSFVKSGCGCSVERVLIQDESYIFITGAQKQSDSPSGKAYFAYHIRIGVRNTMRSFLLSYSAIYISIFIGYWNEKKI